MADPITMYKVGSSLLGGFFGNRAAKKKAKAMRAMANYNARIQEQNAKDEAEKLSRYATALNKSQREQFAQARMSAVSRGALEGTGGDLMSLVDMMEAMQLDRVNLKREQDVVLARGFNQAAMTRYSGQLQAQQAESAGRQALLKGIIGAGDAYFKPTVGKV